jgi:hypothetical protein
VSRPLSTGLIVPIEAAAALVAPWAGLIPVASRPLPPHVTALWPFLPVEAFDADAERRLEALLAGVPAFSFALARVAELADAAVLLPEPAAPFRALTRLIWDEWPEYPPYGGAFDDVVPHLAVAVDPPAAARATIERALTPQLPLPCRATEVLVVEETPSGPLRLGRRLPLTG